MNVISSALPSTHDTKRTLSLQLNKAASWASHHITLYKNERGVTHLQHLQN